MKRLVAGALALAAVLGGIWAVQTFAAQKARQSAADSDEAVLAADATLHRALGAADRRTAGAFLDRRFVLVDRTGASFDKPQSLLGTAAAVSEEAERRVRRYGRLAVVTGVARAPGAAPDTFFVHVWLKRRGGWRAVVYQESAAAAGRPVLATVARPAERLPACDNPCKTLPYRPKNVIEQEVVAAFQAIETAAALNDADAWARHVADECVIYGPQAAPRSRAERAAFIRAQQDARAFVSVGEVRAMQLWAFGDVALMTAQHAPGDGASAPYRATRIWVRRDGRWQLALSQQTAITR